jgi:hypothetical protein
MSHKFIMLSSAVVRPICLRKKLVEGMGACSAHSANSKMSSHQKGTFVAFIIALVEEVPNFQKLAGSQERLIFPC